MLIGMCYLANAICSSIAHSDWSKFVMENLITLPPRGVRNIAMSVSVCLSVCRTRKSHELHHVACGHGSVSPPLTALRYVKYFWFCGWRHVFIPWGQWTRIKHAVMCKRSSPGGGTSWTSNNYSVWSSSSECGTGGKVCYNLWFPCFLYVAKICLYIWIWLRPLSDLITKFRSPNCTQTSTGCANKKTIP